MFRFSHSSNTAGFVFLILCVSMSAVLSMAVVIGCHTPYMHRISGAEEARPGALIPDIYKPARGAFLCKLVFLRRLIRVRIA